MDYANLKTEELEIENAKLSEQRAKLRAEQLKIKAVLDARAIEESLARKLAALSAEEIAALKAKA